MDHWLKIVGLFLILVLTNCKREPPPPIYSVYKPVLIESDKVTTDVRLLPATSNKMITMMHTSGNYLFALDYGLGIHILDITDPVKPVKRGFYQVPACIDFEVKDNKVYANNYRDFIVVDFSDVNNPVITKRESGAFDIIIKTPDGLSIHDKLRDIPPNTTIISYEKI